MEMQISHYQSLNNMPTLSYHHHQVFPKEEYEEVFSVPSQLPVPPLDFSGILGYNGWDFHHEVFMQESSFPFLDSSDQMLLYDPYYYSPPLDFSHTFLPDGLMCNNFENVLGVWDETMGTGFQGQSEPMLDYNVNIINPCNGKMIDNKDEEKKKGIKRSYRDEEEYSNSKKLTRKIISQYFYMPITQAARELNVGLTLLKKRCRELGIRRWPHRKLMSLQTLIKNVQAEFGKEECEAKLKESLEILEQEKKLLEEIPDMQLEDKTKRLRQAFFKANYKKRKLMGVIDSSSPNTADDHDNAIPDQNAATSSFSAADEEEEEDLKLFFSDDCFTSTPTF